MSMNDQGLDPSTLERLKSGPYASNVHHPLHHGSLQIFLVQRLSHGADGCIAIQTL
jgi:hypothetical protein